MARRAREIPLPRSWPDHARGAVLQAVALAHHAMTVARGWCADSRIVRVRQAAEIARLRQEIALLTDELAIKDARMAHIPPARRPHYPPAARLAILAQGAARGWSASQLAERFLVTVVTIASWRRRVDEHGEASLVQLARPVNRFPDFVGEIVHRLKATVPEMGKVRIAQVLARAGLHLSASTTARLLARPAPKAPAPPPEPAPAPARGRAVIARAAHHVWGVDLTVVPTALGFWVPWAPFSALQRWPFCWVVVVVVDHFSRRALAARRFDVEPTARDVCDVLDAARAAAGTAPRHAVTDSGAQFQGEYLAWCERHGVRPRFGAIGKHGSIAVIERFIRSLKGEAFGVPGVPLGHAAMQGALDRYLEWYAAERPHQGLAGRTPREVTENGPGAHAAPRFEPRARYPARAPCAAPQASVRGRRGAKLELIVAHPPAAPHLPSVALRRVA